MSSRKLIFVTSLERSGSTLLDITLGRHPQIVSFGEVARVLLPHGGGGMKTVVKRPCSCGELAENCPFWKGVIEKISEQESELSLTERYHIFLAQFVDTYGEDFIPVDSSKFLRAIDAVHQLDRQDLELKILFTIRDVRGWGSSSRRAARRKREIPFSAIFTPEIDVLWRSYLRHNVLRHLPFWLPLEWYLRNGKIERSITGRKLDIERLSYERFALDTENLLADVFRFLGVPNSPLNNKSASHIIRGNRMAFDPANVSIRYDYSWFYDLWTQYEAMAWPFVIARNNKWVYGK